MDEHDNGWSEYSKFVLAELKRLNACYESISAKMVCDVHSERIKNLDQRIAKAISIGVVSFMTVIIGGVVFGIWIKLVLVTP